MKIDLAAKGMELSDDLKSYVNHKMGSFERHIKEVGDGEVEVVITFSVEKHGNRNRVDIDVYLKTRGGGALHSWEESNDIYKSLEIAIDDVERQLHRLKDRRLDQRKQIQREKMRNQTEELPNSFKDEFQKIIEEKMSILKPMTAEDASIILVSEERFFFPFRNAASGEVNVIYRKTNGSYGVISP